MSGLPELLLARQQLHDRIDTDVSDLLGYARASGINLQTLHGYVGAFGTATAVDCGDRRFDLADGQEDAFKSFVLEVLGEDGESVIDIACWPLDRPQHALTMFGFAGLLGAWEMANPASFFMGDAIPLHRSPLEWLRAGCRGAAILVPRLAACRMLDAPGKIAARDQAHGRELVALLKSVHSIEAKIVVAPSQPRRAAA